MAERGEICFSSLSFWRTAFQLYNQVIVQGEKVVLCKIDQSFHGKLKIKRAIKREFTRNRLILKCVTSVMKRVANDGYDAMTVAA